MLKLDDNPNIDDKERAHLWVLVTTDGWQVYQEKILEPIINRFNTLLMNTNPSDEKQVLANHALAKAAQMVYAGIAERLNHQIEIYRNGKEKKEPEDSTNGILDLGGVE